MRKKKIGFTVLTTVWGGNVRNESKVIVIPEWKKYLPCLTHHCYVM